MSRTPPYPDDVRVEACRLRAEGRTLTEIAQALCVGVGSVVRWTVGVEGGRHHRRYPEGIIETALRRRREGASITEVAAELDVPRDRVYRWVAEVEQSALVAHTCRERAYDVAQELRCEGKTIREIALIVGVPRPTVGRWLVGFDPARAASRTCLLCGKPVSDRGGKTVSNFCGRPHKCKYLRIFGPISKGRSARGAEHPPRAQLSGSVPFSNGK